MMESDPDYETYQIELKDPNGTTHAGVLTLHNQENSSCRLILHFDSRTLSGTATDFFDAFCQIRLALEAEGVIPICYGASLNVFPSGMCSDMGAGLKAYKHTIGQRGRLQDLVDTFATGDDVIPATVAEQADFRRRWIGSWLQPSVE